MPRIRNKRTGEIREISDEELQGFRQQQPRQTGEARQITPDMLTQIILSPDVSKGDKAAAREIFGIQQEARERQEKIIEKEEEKGPMPELVRAVNLLEKEFFGEKGERTIARGKEGLGGRLPGTLALLEAQHAPSEKTEDIRTFQRTLESIGAQLAKAGGDAGNIALVEQLLARQQFGKVTDTPNEAVEAFKAAREKFGLPESEILTNAEKRIGKTDVEEKDLSDRGFLEKLTSLEGTKQFVGEVPGIAAEGVVATGQNIVDLLQGDFESVKKRSGEFEPKVERTQELSEAAQDEIATKIETVAGIKTLKNILGPKLKSVFGEKAPQLTDDILKQGTKNVAKGKEIRTAAIDKADDLGKKVDGNKIYDSVKSWADDAINNATPQEEKAINQLLKKTEGLYKDKLIDPKKAKRIWDTATKGFSASGRAGETVKAGFHRAVRDGVRGTLDDVTGGAFEKGTKIIREGLSDEKLLKGISDSRLRAQIKAALQPTPSPVTEFLKGTGKRTAQLGLGGAGLYALSKMLGLDVPGAIREPQ
jgi:hypothetical protein